MSDEVKAKKIAERAMSIIKEAYIRTVVRLLVESETPIDDKGVTELADEGKAAAEVAMKALRNDRWTASPVEASRFA